MNYTVVRAKIIEKAFSAFIYVYNSDTTTFLDKTLDILKRVGDNNYYYLDNHNNLDLGFILERRINVIVPIITPDCINAPDTLLDKIFDCSVSNSIPLFPICFDKAILTTFNNRYGNIHCYYLEPRPNNDSITDLSSKFSLLLSTNEEIDKIHAHFNANLFLSYRKKNARFINKFMSIIHSDPDLRDVSIWYDNDLIPGEDFNDSIETALNNCKAMLLLVTPDLLEPGNYVMNIEYTTAVNQNIPVIPFEFVPTNYVELQASYPNIISCVDIESAESVKEAINVIKSHISLRLDNSAEHLYYIGLAYLFGIGVERNYERGKELITSATHLGFKDAYLRLGIMYYYGNGVPKDNNLSYMYLCEYFKYIHSHQEFISNNDLHDHIVTNQEVIFPVEFKEQLKFYKLLSESIKVFVDITFELNITDLPREFIEVTIQYLKQNCILYFLTNEHHTKSDYSETNDVYYTIQGRYVDGEILNASRKICVFWTTNDEELWRQYVSALSEIYMLWRKNFSLGIYIMISGTTLTGLLQLKKRVPEWTDLPFTWPPFSLENK